MQPKGNVIIPLDTADLMLMETAEEEEEDELDTMVVLVDTALDT